MGSIRKSSRDTPQDLDVELSNYIADIDDIIRKDSTASGGGGGGYVGVPPPPPHTHTQHDVESTQ